MSSNCFTKLCGTLKVFMMQKVGLALLVVVALSILVFPQDKLDSPDKLVSPQKAYSCYVDAVNKEDFKCYQWSVADAVDKGKFKELCKQRKEKDLVPIVVNLKRLKIPSNPQKGEAGPLIALSPWDRQERKYQFRKIGESWKVIEGNE